MKSETTCRSCSAPIYMAETPKGRLMPVDRVPAPGHISIRRDALANREIEQGAAVFAKGTPLKRGAREMLAALAMFHPKTLSRPQIGAFVQLASQGSTFTSYLSSLRSAGLLTEPGDRIGLTDAGLEAARDAPPLPSSTSELVRLWGARLKAGARAMLDHLVAQHPAAVSREQLGEAVGLPHQGSTFTSYLSSLRRAELLDESGEDVRASETLFLEAP